VEINCAAIPANLLESELFGHEKGAFTDARSAKPGLFEAAHGGTLFLDEIGHLPFELQGKVLKAIEEKRIRRVGAVAMKEVDVRIIAATHVDLTSAVARGEFREDLFYRLSVVPIHLPPLRERGEDVLLLARHFLLSLGEQYGIAPPPLTPEMRGTLLAHRWPGNVRELRNALERALLLGEATLTSGDLFHRPVASAASSGPLPFPAPLAEIERAAARVMLDRFGGNKKAAADALAISRSRLYRLLDDSG
jgi:transcriptional regulator with PAS, ATPase and Fis domain